MVRMISALFQIAGEIPARCSETSPPARHSAASAPHGDRDRVIAVALSDSPNRSKKHARMLAPGGYGVLGSPTQRPIVAVMRERLSIIGIMVFVVLDVILVALAVQHTRGTPPPSDVPSVNRSADSADDERSDRPAREREGAAESREGDVDPAEPLYMSVAADESYVRATRGSC